MFLVLLWTVSATVHSEEHHLVIMDVDPGIDDAMAILTALGDPTVTVMAITCVRGNTEIANVIINVYKTLYVAGKLDIPVYEGAGQGLIFSPVTDGYFGKDGFGELGNKLTFDPAWLTKVQKEPASIFLSNVVNEKPGQITVVALGPLTNIALALEINPLFLNKLKKLIILGGTVKGMGNVRPGMEFNFYIDPDAAAIVMDRASSSNTSVDLVPMETVVDCELGMKWRLFELTKVENKAMKFLDTVEGKHREIHPWAADEYTPYDTYAVVALINPAAVNRTDQLYGYVETTGSMTRGVLLVDYVKLTNKRPNINVIMAMNKKEIRKTIVRGMSNFKPGVNIWGTLIVAILVLVVLACVVFFGVVYLKKYLAKR